MRAPGEILLIAGYELGHQPLAVAWPAAFLERLGYQPAVMDVSVEAFDARRARQAKLVAVSVPMHTALRIGVTVIDRVRAVNPDCHLCFYGLYASLNAEYLLGHGADSVIGGEAEGPLGELATALETGAATPSSVEDKGATGRALSQAPRLSRPEPRAASCPSDVREDRARRPARSGRVRRGEPRLPASLPALPDPAGLWRPVLRGAARRRPRGHPATGGGGRHSHHLRRPRLSERAHACAPAGARAPRGDAGAHLRLHREDRAPDRPSGPPEGARGLRRHLRRLRRRVAEPGGPRAPRQGPYAGRYRPGDPGGARGGHRLPADLGRVHALDHPDRLPGDARFHRGARS